MFCAQCGAQVAETAGFCSNCGAKVAASRPAVPEPMTAHAPMPGAPPSVATTPPAIAPPSATATPSVAGTLSAAGSVKYAGFWIRWVACLIDGIFISVPLAFVAALASAVGTLSDGQGGPNAAGILFFLFYISFAFAATWLYYALLESSPEQGTLGKRILRLKVTDIEGRRIGFGRATGRFWARILSGIPFNIGYIMAAFSDRKQALHDMIAKTLVVRT